MGHGTLEWVYIGVVVAVLIYIGADAWNVERFLDHAPEDAQVVKVTGQQWFWTFEHEDGRRELGELHLVKDTPYFFKLQAKDVLHDFWVPEFRLKSDAVPGIRVFGPDDQRRYQLIGRLADGVTIEQARDDVRRVAGHAARHEARSMCIHREYLGVDGSLRERP